MKIIVLAEQECYRKARSDALSQEPYVIISIRDKGKQPINILKTYKNVTDVMSLSFDDVTRGEGSFTKCDAIKIKCFVDKYNTIGVIAIHCFAGQSRSYAVAKSIKRYLKDVEICVYNKNCSENPLVIKVLSKVLR